MTRQLQPKSYHDQAIEAAYLHTKPGFYFIGPFSRRVSFASQQYRAIDLVNALEAKNKLKDAAGRRRAVAVVGGGLAGLTAAAMLSGYGCPVEVFESAGSVLHLQQAACHRLIHPTINRWPGYPLEYGTKFGFLDWCAGTADQVITALRSDQDRHAEKLRFGGAPCRAFSDAKVVELIHNKRVSIRNTAAKANPAEAANRKTFDLCIVTTGFGRESAPAGLTAVSYWDVDDQIDAWRASPETVYVSGCGDGGLIDCLRLVHGHFENGWLTVRLAQLLSREIPDQLDAIEAAEEDALLMAKSIRCMGIANPTKDQLLTDQDDRVSDALGKFYEDFFNMLPERAISVMDRSIEASAVNIGKVRLIALEAKPFIPSSTPIHKIMLAHAMQRNFVTYRRGTLSKTESGPKFRLVSGENWPDRADAPVVIRHGPHAPMEGLIEKPEVESLRLRQFMLADFLDVENEREMPQALRRPPAGPVKGHAAAKLEWVAQLMQAVRPGCGVGWDKDGFVYNIVGDEPDGADLLPALEVPEELFGLKLREGPVDDASAL